MTLLNSAQVALIKAARLRSYNRTFSVLTYMAGTGTDAYDPTSTGEPTVTVLSGDWVWKHQHDLRGRVGGIVDSADLLLTADLLQSGTFVSPNTKLRVDGILCAITSVTPYQETGEVVVTGVRVAV